MQHPRPRPGARGNLETGVSIANDALQSGNPRVPFQAIPECDAEALAWGFGLPPADHVTACRAMWLRLRMRGVPLPAEPRIILIEGGAI